ncbi:MAG: hypothetical protein K2N34_01230 [Lachnospiraceae bacterium]|nr:hypothetical protein [Lachnospiraceae bacterium]
MIKDLELMKDITPLFDRKLIIWGIGQKGRIVIEDLKAMGAGKGGIFLCDSNCKLWGEEIYGNRVLSPDELQSAVNEIDLKGIIFLVTARLIKGQDEIIEDIKKRFGDSMDICTLYAIESGMTLNVKNPYVENGFRERKLAECEQIKCYNPRLLRQKEETFKYFGFLPLHEDEIILIYQPAKVGSSSIYKSIKSYNRHVLHCHTLRNVGVEADDLYRILNLKSGKIISLVRDPIARRISEMWQCITYSNRYDAGADFSEIDEWHFEGEFWNGEFEWFDLEMKSVFQIDVFTHPFDKEKGYSLIKQGNIELLLLKMEKMNELEDVIGEFLNVDKFQLSKHNIGKDKAYRYALQSYIKDFTIAQENLEEIYKKNEYMKHFYSEEERTALYEKWMKHLEK